MGRRDNPHAKAEIFMKIFKVETVYPMTFAIFENVSADLLRFIDEVCNAR